MVAVICMIQDQGERKFILEPKDENEFNSYLSRNKNIIIWATLLNNDGMFITYQWMGK